VSAVIARIITHQAARAKIAMMVPELDDHAYGAAVSTEEDAARALAETPCANDDEFFAAACMHPGARPAR